MTREDEESLARACSDVAAAMASPETGTGVVHRIAVRAADLLRVGSAGVILAGADGEPDLTVATNRLVQDVYEVEQADGDGPSYAARGRNRPVPLATLVDAAPEWDRWTEQARNLGVGAWLAVPSHTRRPALLVAATNRPRAWTPEDIELAQVLVDLAAGCAAWDTELDHARRAADQLQEALDHRVVIEQAKGLLAGERGCSLDEAFGLLRDQARRRSVTVRSVADAVVHLGLRPP